MENSLDNPTPLWHDGPPDGDTLRLRYWAAFYALFLIAAGLPMAWLMSSQGASLSDWLHHTKDAFRLTSPAVKLLSFTIYMSLCCTFLPLPTTWLVAGMATRAAAVAGDVWSVTLAVAVAGAIGSTIANLNDYHIMTWMLRSDRIAAVRHTKFYRASATWFSRSPFFILVVFNVIPFPIDVARLLAVAWRYPRGPFAAANFVGRFIRYGLVAFLMYQYDLGRNAVYFLLGLAVALAAVKVLPAAFKHAWQRFRRPAANHQAAGVSQSKTHQKESD